MKIKQVILDKIKELDKSNLSILEADGILVDYLIKAMPKDVQEAYEKMISNKIPF